MTRIKTCRQACYLSAMSWAAADGIFLQKRSVKVSNFLANETSTYSRPNRFFICPNLKRDHRVMILIQVHLSFLSFAQWFALFTTDWQSAQCNRTVVVLSRSFRLDNAHRHSVTITKWLCKFMKLMKLKRVMQEKDMLLLSSLPEFHLRRGVGPRKASEEAAWSSTGPNLWRAHVEWVVKSRGCWARPRCRVPRRGDGAWIRRIFAPHNRGHAPVIMGQGPGHGDTR